MDQMAIAMGGICHIDFKDPASPDVQKLDVDFPEMGYSICITDTHGSHAEHTDDYADVQTDLQKAASVFGKQVLEDVSRAEVIECSAQIREVGGDRAFLRAMHVAAENERVRREAEALKRKDMQAFLFLVRRSGDSSYKLLQNVYTDRTPGKQELAVALSVSEAVLINNHTTGGVLDAAASSACRVHGGGFAGTIEAFVPEEEADDYKAAMDEVFGEGSCFLVRICPEGGMEVC
jgi:galactokinase